MKKDTQAVQNDQYEVTTTQKIVLSDQDYEKEVEKTYAFLTYIDGVAPKDARRQANEEVAEKYELAKRRAK